MDYYKYADLVRMGLSLSLSLSSLSLSIFLSLSGLRHVIMYNLMNAVWQSYNGSSRSSRSLGLITTVWTNCLKNEAKAGITKIFVNDLIGLTVSHYDTPNFLRELHLKLYGYIAH